MNPADLTARTIHGGVELLVDQKSGATIGPIEPFESISLANELIGCAIAVMSVNPPPLGSIVSALDIPTESTSIRLDADGRIVMDLKIPPNNLFSFRLAPNVAGFLSRELLRMLMADS